MVEGDRFDVRLGVVDVAGGRLFVREVGDEADPAVVVMHGGPDFDHGYLLPELDALATSVRLVYFDQRGRGRSTLAGEPGDVTIQTEVDDVDAIRVHLGLDVFIILGHSWGALLALEYAIRHRDRVSHLVLVNVAPISAALAARHRQSLRDSRPPDETAAMDTLMSSRRYQSGDLAADADYHRLHFAHALRRPELLEPLVQRLRRNTTAEVIRTSRLIEHRLYDQTWSRPAYDLGPKLRTLDLPTLIVHGDRDLFPVDVARYVHEQLPNSQLVIVEECGHFVYLEHPLTFQQVVSAFLEDAAPTQPTTQTNTESPGRDNDGN